MKNENWSTGDGNLSTTEVYKNTHGQKILECTYIKEGTTTQKLETYYVYDIYGLLRYVIPPKAIQEIGTAPDNRLGIKRTTNYPVGNRLS